MQNEENSKNPRREAGISVLLCVLNLRRGNSGFARRSLGDGAGAGAAGGQVVGHIPLQPVADEGHAAHRGFGGEGQQRGAFPCRRDGKGASGGQPQLHAYAGQIGRKDKLRGQVARRQQGTAVDIGRGAAQGVLLPAGAEQHHAVRLEIGAVQVGGMGAGTHRKQAAGHGHAAGLIEGLRLPVTAAQQQSLLRGGKGGAAAGNGKPPGNDAPSGRLHRQLPCGNGQLFGKKGGIAAGKGDMPPAHHQIAGGIQGDIAAIQRQAAAGNGRQGSLR